ncbi:MAG TPA: hypothetical protein VIE89_23945 [Candidatus Binatia bacterium]|jgi:hypothetical protein
MRRFSPAITVSLVIAFSAGFVSHHLYQRWHPASEKNPDSRSDGDPPSFRVTFVPTSAAAELPLVQAREVEKIRSLTGNQARIRGRVFRVGYSTKSNTYFLNFGPSRESLTAVIFASSAELFEKSKLQPRSFEGKEVELHGEIKDHPQYGLELILEDPAQIKLLD